MISTQISGFYHFYPCTVTLVGAQRGDQVNFMAAAWNVALSFRPPLFGVSIAPQRYTHDMILETGEFTCNFLDMKHLDTVHGCGRVSGRDGDKVDRFSIPLEEPTVISCPTIASAYSAYECRLVHQYPVGDHNLFVGEVVAVHTQSGLTNDVGILNPEKIDFSLYLGSNTYLTADPASLRKMPAEIE